MTTIIARNRLTWTKVNKTLVLKLGHKPTATLRAHTAYPGMWRVAMPDGTVSDMTNLSRAKDAACALTLAKINRPQEAQERAA